MKNKLEIMQESARITGDPMLVVGNTQKGNTQNSKFGTIRLTYENKGRFSHTSIH
jgi:hypothetical protein